MKHEWCDEHWMTLPCGGCRADALVAGAHSVGERGPEVIHLPDLRKLAAGDTDDWARCTVRTSSPRTRTEEAMSPFGSIDRANCPDAPHRGPQGPSEDLSQCRNCWSPSWAKRPQGEEFGGHLDDCSLPRDHESYCEPGGSGHPAPEVRRGFWP